MWFDTVTITEENKMSEQDDFQPYRDKVGSGRGDFESQYSRIIRTWNKVHSDSMKEIEEGRDNSLWRRDYAEQHLAMAGQISQMGGDRERISDHLEALKTHYRQTLDKPGISDAIGYAVVELENLLNAE
jgi:hypothetical protein